MKRYKKPTMTLLAIEMETVVCNSITLNGEKQDYNESKHGSSGGDAHSAVWDFEDDEDWSI